MRELRAHAGGDSQVARHEAAGEDGHGAEGGGADEGDCQEEGQGAEARLIVFMLSHVGWIGARSRRFFHPP